MLRLGQLFRIGELLGERSSLSRKLFSNELSVPMISRLTDSSPLLGGSVRFYRFKEKLFEIPKAGDGYFRRTVHYPEKYTIKPVPYTNLAGRDPVTGK